MMIFEIIKKQKKQEVRVYFLVNGRVNRSRSQEKPPLGGGRGGGGRGEGAG